MNRQQSTVVTTPSSTTGSTPIPTPAPTNPSLSTPNPTTSPDVSATTHHPNSPAAESTVTEITEAYTTTEDETTFDDTTTSAVTDSSEGTLDNTMDSVIIELADDSSGIEGVELPANFILISSELHGDLGIELPIEITAEQLREARLDLNNVSLYYISAEITVTELPNAVTVNDDGSVTITVSHFSTYVLSETPPLINEISQSNPNIFLIVGLIAAVVIIGVLIVFIINLKRKLSVAVEENPTITQ
jgi:hypothetical protein